MFVDREQLEGSVKKRFFYAFLFFTFLALICSLTIGLDNNCEKNENPSLIGSYEARLRRNIEADRENLIRIKNNKELLKMRELGTLVELKQDANIQIDYRLDKKFRFYLPITKVFVLNFGKDFRTTFPDSKHKIQINSAVRTVVSQKILKRKNRNAADATGPLASSHETGATVDMAKLNLSPQEISWIRFYLLNLEGVGSIEATEEFEQQVFDVMVFACYQDDH